MVSMQEIADKIGVSRNTVSKVLNNKEGVSSAVRRAILQTSVEMGYKKLPLDPDKISSLSIAQKNILILVTNPEFSPYWMHILNGVASELNKSGCNLIYNHIYNDKQGADNVSESIKTNNLAGIIVINVYDKTIIGKIAESGLPTIYYDIPVNVTCTEAKGDVVIFEGRHSIACITEHVLSQGIRKIGFIGDITYARSIYERWAGFKSALSDSGIAPEPAVCLTKGLTNHFYDQDEVGQALAQLDEFPDAFICANDIIAYMAIKYLETKGVRVPGDLLVSGYDNIKESIMSDNRLTTVEASVEYLGQCLVKQLFDLIDNPSRPYVTVLIETRPILRESTEVQA